MLAKRTVRGHELIDRVRNRGFFYFILFFSRNPNVLMFKKKIESRRVFEANDNGEETVEYSSTIPELATEGIFLINKVFNIRKVLFIKMYFATC
jgi:hypothetical protein